MVAVVLGTIAAATTTIPYSIVKTGSPLPSGPQWMYLAIVGGSLVISLAATFTTAARATRPSPILALAA